MGKYDLERSIATAAVLSASLLAREVQASIVQGDAVSKDDKSPVTVADYASQLVVTSLLSHHFPTIPIIGEESSSSFKSKSNDPVLSQVIELSKKALESKKEDENVWKGLKVPESEKEWLEILDRGESKGVGKEGRMWTLDPIDGTKGFLRQGQYAVCLALIENGEVVLGVTGCPNLPVDFLKAREDKEGEKGTIFIGVKDEGAFQRSLTSPTLFPIQMTPLSPSSTSSASFCESVEAGHSDQSTNARIASLLGITKEPVRMDSQAKYCSIARGDGDIYLRLPTSKTYEEKIWDHASGNILVHEAGGIVSDIHGKTLDFTLGRTLKNNKGVVAASKESHSKVIEAVGKALEEKEKGAL